MRVSRFPIRLLAALLMGFALHGVSAEVIDINTADAATLADAMSGIGPAKAEAIVAYRNEHGPFKSVDDLMLIKGIGTATIDRNRDKLGVSTAGE